MTWTALTSSDIVCPKRIAWTTSRVTSDAGTMTRWWRWGGPMTDAVGHLGLDPSPAVLAADEQHRRDEDRDDDDDQPGAERELGDGEDDRDDRRGDRAAAVDDHASTPAVAVAAPPVDDHAGLRQRDRGEDADGVERDQRLDPAAERDQRRRSTATASATIPVLNASRSPRNAKRLGM